MSNSAKMKVQVREIGEEKTFGTSGFRKRELITTIQDGEHTNYFVFEFVQDKCDLLEDLLEDSFITVHYNIRCRKVERDGKDTMYFTSLSGWKVEV